MTKTYRQGQILKLIRGKKISTQDELAQELKALDIAATQVTLSRDIRDLRLSEDTRRLSGNGARGDWSRNSPCWRPEFLRRTFSAAQNLVVLKTSPGHANSVAVALDNEEWPEVAGHHRRRRYHPGHHSRWLRPGRRFRSYCSIWWRRARRRLTHFSVGRHGSQRALCRRCGSGSATSIKVPLPGPDVIFTDPPRLSARSCIPVRPEAVGTPVQRSPGHRPVPGHRSARHAVARTVISTALALACFCTLWSASSPARCGRHKSCARRGDRAADRRPVLECGGQWAARFHVPASRAPLRVQDRPTSRGAARRHIPGSQQASFLPLRGRGVHPFAQILSWGRVPQREPCSSNCTADIDCPTASCKSREMLLRSFPAWPLVWRTSLRVPGAPPSLPEDASRVCFFQT